MEIFMFIFELDIYKEYLISGMNYAIRSSPYLFLQRNLLSKYISGMNHAIRTSLYLLLLILDNIVSSDRVSVSSEVSQSMKYIYKYMYIKESFPPVCTLIVKFTMQ